MLFAILLFLAILPFAITGWLFAPWVPVSKDQLERIASLVKIKPHQTFYELGCGDGRVVDFIAKKFNCKAIGVELNPFMYLTCLFKKGHYVLGDLFSQNLSNADFVYLFGLPRVLNSRLKQKLEKELKPGATVISYAFMITGWKPVKIDKQPQQLPVFIYKLDQKG